MGDVFHLTVITPDKEFYQGQVFMVELVTTEGGMGVYQGHSPMTAAVAPGILRIHEGDKLKEAALLSGFLEISGDHMIVLAEIVEWPGEIDKKRAEEARIRAERRLKDGNSEVDVVKAQLALRKALVRLGVEG